MNIDNLINSKSGFYNNGFNYSIILSFNIFKNFINSYNEIIKYNYVVSIDQSDMVLKIVFLDNEIEKAYNFLKKFKISLNLESVN